MGDSHEMEARVAAITEWAGLEGFMEVPIRSCKSGMLAWLGLPVGDDMDGRVASFLHGVEVQRIASHDTSPVERAGALPSGAEEQILEDLEALGYFEEPAGE